MSLSEAAPLAGRSLGGGRRHREKFLWEYIPEGNESDDHRLVHSVMIHYGVECLPYITMPFPKSQSEIRDFHTARTSVFISAPDERFRNMAGISPSTLGACQIFQKQEAGFTLNWAGDMQPSQASAICLINDVVLALLDLLKSYKRILYVDVGAHHVDGVERAFIRSNRVMTLSFNKYGDFSSNPSTDIGVGHGQHHALNVSLAVRTTETDFLVLFEPIIEKAISVFDPMLIVLQTGIESLSLDESAKFNISTKSHINCLAVLRKSCIPVMLLGNLVHCWCSETGIVLQKDIIDDYFVQHQNVKHDVVKQEDKGNLDDIKNKVFSHFDAIEHVPVAGLQEITEVLNDISADFDLDNQEYEFVEKVPIIAGGRKAWTNPFACKAAKTINRVGKTLASQESAFMEYNNMLLPYSDFLKYVGQFSSRSDGPVPPVLSTISSASRSVGTATTYGGSMLRYGARAVSKYGRRFQIMACPEAAVLGDGTKAETYVLIANVEEARDIITKWKLDDKPINLDVSKDMSLEEAKLIGDQFLLGGADELIKDSPVLGQKMGRYFWKC